MSPGRRPRPPRFVRGVRTRSALAAVLVVAVALAAGTVLFVVVLQRTLVTGVDQTATDQATRIAVQVGRDGPSGIDASLDRQARRGQVVQVLDASGRVVAASSDRGRAGALSDAQPAPGAVVHVIASRVPLLDDDDPYLVVVAGVRSAGPPYRVAVATSIADQQQAVRAALELLLLGLPVLLVVAGGATWLVVGRALRPVERMRARVSEIGGTRDAGRIPVPDSGDEVERLAVTMNEMLGRLDEARSTQRRFVADASHELRSPIATLSAGLELAAARGRLGDLAPVMVQEAARMARLVEDLLLLSKADEHSMRLDRDEVDLDDLVHEQARRLRTQPALTVALDVQPVRVEGDRARLGQTVTNLVDNAARHAHQVVTLTLQPTAAGARVVVDDDGDGIPAADRERVLRRFVRLDDSRSRGSGGSGLGLAIADEVARAHGGRVVVGRSPSGGARVELLLPSVLP